MGAVVQMRMSKVKPSAERAARPFSTFYYHVADDKESEFAKTSRAASDVGAVKAAFVRLFIGQYKAAVICDEDGVVKYRLSRKGRIIHVTGLFIDFERYMLTHDKVRV